MSDETRQPEESADSAADPAVAAPAPAGDEVAVAPVEAPAEDAASSEPAAEQAPLAEPADAPEVEAAAAEVTAESGSPAAVADEPVDDELSDEADESADDEEEEETIAVAPAGPIEEIADEEEDIHLDWYILKVQSNRERTSSEALKRKVAIEGIDRFFGEIIVPTEKVTEFKNGKKKTVQRKIWPGYIAVQMHVNDDTWFAIRETSGIGDFTGASGKPIPMSPGDVEKILPKEEGEEGEDDTPKLNIKFAEGDKVKVTDGNFENFEGEVDTIDQHSGKITVMISIFGRSTPVELEYWQVETV